MKYLVFFILLVSFSFHTKAQRVDSLASFPAEAAGQAVAVSENFIFAINNTTIEKYDKQTHELLKVWEDTSGTFKHLNSGVVLNGKLYCAHSNFPDVPMASSIEVFDVQDLRPVEGYSLGIQIGSATWVDKFDGHWYVAFAHYQNKGGEKDRDNRWTQLVEFDEDWHRERAWIFPKEMNERFRPMSNSGGFISSSGQLFITGHDYKEIYLMEFPKNGYMLKWKETLEAPFEGQGIAVDPADDELIYGISRSQKRIIKGRLNSSKR